MLGSGFILASFQGLEDKKKHKLQAPQASEVRPDKGEDIEIPVVGPPVEAPSVVAPPRTIRHSAEKKSVTVSQKHTELPEPVIGEDKWETTHSETETSVSVVRVIAETTYATGDRTPNASEGKNVNVLSAEPAAGSEGTITPQSTTSTTTLGSVEPAKNRAESHSPEIVWEQVDTAVGGTDKSEQARRHDLDVVAQPASPESMQTKEEPLMTMSGLSLSNRGSEKSPVNPYSTHRLSETSVVEKAMVVPARKKSKSAGSPIMRATPAQSMQDSESPRSSGSVVDRALPVPTKKVQSPRVDTTAKQSTKTTTTTTKEKTEKTKQDFSSVETSKDQDSTPVRIAKVDACDSPLVPSRRRSRETPEDSTASKPASDVAVPADNPNKLAGSETTADEQNKLVPTRRKSKTSVTSMKHEGEPQQKIASSKPGIQTRTLEQAKPSPTTRRSKLTKTSEPIKTDSMNKEVITVCTEQDPARLALINPESVIKPSIATDVEKTTLERTGTLGNLTVSTTLEPTSLVTGTAEPKIQPFQTKTESAKSPITAESITGLAETGVVLEEPIVVPARRKIKSEGSPMTQADVKPAQSIEDSESPQPSPIGEEQAALSNSQSTSVNEIVEPHSVKKVALVVLDIPALQTVDTCPQTSSSERADSARSIGVDVTLGQASKKSEPTVLPQPSQSNVNVPQSLQPEKQHPDVPQPESTDPTTALLAHTSVTAPAPESEKSPLIPYSTPALSETAVVEKAMVVPARKKSKSSGSPIMRATPAQSKQDSSVSVVDRASPVPTKKVQSPKVDTTAKQPMKTTITTTKEKTEKTKQDLSSVEASKDQYSTPVGTAKVDFCDSHLVPRNRRSRTTPEDSTASEPASNVAVPADVPTKLAESETTADEQTKLVPTRRKSKTSVTSVKLDGEPQQKIARSKPGMETSTLEQAKPSPTAKRSKLTKTSEPIKSETQNKQVITVHTEQDTASLTSFNPESVIRPSVATVVGETTLELITDNKDHQKVSTTSEPTSCVTGPAEVKIESFQTKTESVRSSFTAESITALSETGAVVEEAIVVPTRRKLKQDVSPMTQADVKSAQSTEEFPQPPPHSAEQAALSSSQSSTIHEIVEPHSLKKVAVVVLDIPAFQTADTCPQTSSSTKEDRKKTEDSTASEPASDVAVPADVATKPAESETTADEQTKLVPIRRKSKTSVSSMKVDAEPEQNMTKPAMETVALEQAKPSPPSRKSKSIKTSEPIKNKPINKEVITVQTKQDPASQKSLINPELVIRPSITAAVEETKIEPTGNEDNLEVSRTSEPTSPVTGPVDLVTGAESVKSPVIPESITELAETGVVLEEPIVVPARRMTKADGSPMTQADVKPAQSTEDSESPQPSPITEEQAAPSYSQSTTIHEIVEPHSMKKVAGVVVDIPAVQTIDACPKELSSERADIAGLIGVDIPLEQASKESEPSVLPQSEIVVPQSLIAEGQQPDIPTPEPTEQTTSHQDPESVTTVAAVKTQLFQTKPGMPITKKSSSATSTDAQTKSVTSTVEKTKHVPPTRRTSETSMTPADTEPESSKDSDHKSTDVFTVEPKEVSDLMNLESCVSRESVTMETITAVVEEAQLVPTRRKSQSALSSVQLTDVQLQQQKDSEGPLSPQSPRSDIKRPFVEECPKLAKTSEPETICIGDQTQEPSSLDSSIKLNKFVPRLPKNAGVLEAKPGPTREDPMTSEPEKEEPEIPKSSKPLDPSPTAVVKETQSVLTESKGPGDSKAAVDHDKLSEAKVESKDETNLVPASINSNLELSSILLPIDAQQIQTGSQIVITEQTLHGSTKAKSKSLELVTTSETLSSSRKTFGHLKPGEMMDLERTAAMSMDLEETNKGKGSTDQSVASSEARDCPGAPNVQQRVGSTKESETIVEVEISPMAEQSCVQGSIQIQVVDPVASPFDQQDLGSVVSLIITDSVTGPSITAVVEETQVVPTGSRQSLEVTQTSESSKYVTGPPDLKTSIPAQMKVRWLCESVRCLIRRVLLAQNISLFWNARHAVSKVTRFLSLSVLLINLCQS